MDDGLGLIAGNCKSDEDLQNIDDLVRFRRSSSGKCRAYSFLFWLNYSLLRVPQLYSRCLLVFICLWNLLLLFLAKKQNFPLLFFRFVLAVAAAALKMGRNMRHVYFSTPVRDISHLLWLMFRFLSICSVGETKKKNTKIKQARRNGFHQTRGLADRCRCVEHRGQFTDST